MGFSKFLPPQRWPRRTTCPPSPWYANTFGVLHFKQLPEISPTHLPFCALSLCCSNFQANLPEHISCIDQVEEEMAQLFQVLGPPSKSTQLKAPNGSLPNSTGAASVPAQDAAADRKATRQEGDNHGQPPLAPRPNAHSLQREYSLQQKACNEVCYRRLYFLLLEL